MPGDTPYKETDMATEDRKERLVRYLNDAHAAEEGGLAALKDIAREADDPDVRRAVDDHARVTRTQISRLETRIRELGGGKAAGKGLVDTALAKGSQLVNAFHDKEDKQTQDVIKAYSLEHFEIGMYTSLRAYAEAIGDKETARLAGTLIGEEQQAAERLQRLIPRLAASAVNRTAAGSRGRAGGGRSGGLLLRPSVLLLAGLAVWGARRLLGGEPPR